MTTSVSAGVYCRISVAGIGDTTKTDDQERISRDLAARLEWPVVKVYTDHARSAWQKNRRRPGWDDMLADIKAGRISAVIVYHGDRLIRQPYDLEVLLALADSRGIRLASPTGTRNLDSSEDRFVLRIEAAMACRESDNTSRRRKAQYERWRREGRVRPGGYGGRAFGFSTDGQTHIDAEVAALREAAGRILAGEGLGVICRDLAARGITGVTGKPLGHGALKKALLRPGTAGLMPDGVNPAAWQPVLDRETWESAGAVLAYRSKAFHSYATNASRYLLSGIAVCGACGSALQLRAESRKRDPDGVRDGYGCVKPGCRKVQRNIRLLDAYVMRLTVNQLTRADNPEPETPERPGLAAEFAALTEARAEAAAAVSDPGQPHLPLLLARLDSIDKRLARLREQAGETAREQLIARHAGITYEEFLAGPLSLQRALVSACWKVEVLPASKRGPGFRTEDVRLTPL